MLIRLMLSLLLSRDDRNRMRGPIWNEPFKITNNYELIKY
jgi:hypothetical protein